jgi:NRPS condensation-like uncharacterized protein
MQNRIADLWVRFVISLNGKIEAERLEKAVRILLDAEPILGCRFVENWWSPSWHRRDDLDDIKFFRIVKTLDSKGAIIRFMSEPNNPRTDPLIQVQLVRSESDTICIKMNHMVADAAGSKKYMYQLASIYQKLADDPHYLPPCNVGYDRGLYQISREFGFIDRLRIFRSSYRDRKRKFLPPGGWSFPASSNICIQKTFLTRQLGPKRFRSLKDYGHKHQATLNDIMLAAFYRSLVDVITPNQGTPLRLAFTVDLRRYLPRRKSCMIRNLSNFACMNIGPEIGTTFEDTLGKVQHEIITMKSDYLGLTDYPFGSLFVKVLPFAWYQKLLARSLRRLMQSGNVPPVFTNTGIIDTQQLVFDNISVVDAYLLGATFFPPVFGMALSSFGESLTLSISFCEDTVNKSDVEQLLDCMDAHLSL